MYFILVFEIFFGFLRRFKTPIVRNFGGNFKPPIKGYLCAFLVFEVVINPLHKWF